MRSEVFAICGIPICRVVTSDKIRKYYLLGIPFFKIQTFNKSKKYSLVGLPILKLFYSDRIVEEQKSTNQKIKDIIWQINKDAIVKESDLSFLYASKDDQRQKSAIFGVLPPEKTGIAIFNKYAFVNQIYFDMFSDIRDFLVAKELANNVFDLKTFIKFDASHLYKKFIYVLGNSGHNNPYLNMAIRSLYKEVSWLYIHEADLTGLLYYNSGNNFLSMRKYLIKYYPEFELELSGINDFKEFHKWNQEFKIYGLRVIVGLTNISNFIVNNSICKNLVLKEMKDYKVNIAEVFLPIPLLRDKENFNIQKDKDVIYIGTFGIPRDIKFSMEIVQAIEYLNKCKNINIKLIIAGYGANNFFEKYNFDRNSIVICENVNDEQFYHLIRQVDLVIQLRKKPRGESSGPVMSALALDKKIIASKDFLDKKIEKEVYIIDNYELDYKKIAEKILECITEKRAPNYKEIQEFYTYQNLAKLLDEL